MEILEYSKNNAAFFRVMEVSQNFFSVNFASIVALVVAVMSGVFSIIATRRTTRPQMIQPYLQYLQKKWDLLSEFISHKPSSSNDCDLSTENGQMKAVKAIRELYDYYQQIILTQADLFMECESQYKQLLLEVDAIDKSNNYRLFAIQFNDHPEKVNIEELKDAPYKDFNSFINAMINFSRETESLIQSEKIAILKQLKEISLN